jgi:tripartite-type tricarboxylate transporter receptor subunit TctC
MSGLLRAAAVACVLASVLVTQPARGETIEEFFRGKQISLVIGFPPGGAYDLYARAAGLFLPRYLPGHPTIVARNLPGVAGIKAANYLYGQAPRDGLTLGMISQGTALTQALHDPSVEFEAREFGWIGRFASAVQVTEVWHTVPVKTIFDATKRETVVAATSGGSTTDMMPRLMNRLVGTRFKIIKGYNGLNATAMAMERGEVEGAYDSVDSLLFIRPDWLRDKKISVLVQYAQRRHPALADTPAMVELGKSDADRQLLALFGSTAEVGRALTAPPGLPPDRLAALRQAFAAMVADSAFKEELAKRNMEFGPLTGEALQRMIGETLDVPAAVVARGIELTRE